MKGVGGQIIILEEASRLDQAVFSEVVVPLLGVKNVTLLAISTPLDEGNFYSQLLSQKKPNGDPLFNAVEVRLLCDKCKEEGKLECPHVVELPPWKTSERQDLVRSLMSSDKAMYLREQLGIVTSGKSCAFHVPSIARFNDPNEYIINSQLPSAREVRSCAPYKIPSFAGYALYATCLPWYGV